MDLILKVCVPTQSLLTSLMLGKELPTRTAVDIGTVKSVSMLLTVSVGVIPTDVDTYCKL